MSEMWQSKNNYFEELKMTFEETPKQFQEWFEENICDYSYGESWSVWFHCWKDGYYVGLHDTDDGVLQ